MFALLLCRLVTPGTIPAKRFFPQIEIQGVRKKTKKYFLSASECKGLSGSQITFLFHFFIMN